MGIQIFVNLDARSLSTARSNGVSDTRNINFKQFVVGDSEVLDVFLVSGQSRYQPDAHNIQDYSVRLGLGTLNGKPSEGTFDLGSQTGLAHDIDDAGLDAAITAEVAACAVTKLSNFVFKVVFDATGAQSIPTVDASNLGPSSTASITRVITGDGSTNEEWVIRFFNNPVTLINDWEAIDLDSDGGKTFTDPLKGYRGSLNLGTSGVYDLMGDASSAVTTLEIEITDTSGRIQTVMQMPVQLYGEVIGQGANGTVEWGSYLTAAKLAESVAAALAAAGVEDGATADQSGAEIKTAYELEADTNAFTDTEQAKLAGVEDSATADQNGAEIKTAYELEADTNAFTDAEKTTLAGVEDGATADQTGAEIKTAYEAEADTNAFTDAELTKLAGIEDSATGDQTGAEIKTAYEAEADTNAFTDAEKATLASIEDSATADQTGAEIKTAYELEADTNAFTDAEKATLAGIISPEAILNPLVEGQGLLNSFVGSAAAYSLRDLNKTNPDVVEVRRGSDETSRVFKANEIGSTLTNWVNAEVALPLDTASGAAAAYSLRDLSVSRADLTSSGDTTSETTGALVAQVRRSSDDEIKSFTAAEVAGSTMVDWVGVGNDGHVTKWYDQSGNDNHAVQATPASQPKVVDGGTLVADGLKFDGGQSLVKTTFTQGQLSQANTAFAVSKILNVGNIAFVFDSSDAAARNMIYAQSSEYRFYAGTDQVIAAQDTDQHLFTALFNTTNSDAYIDGVIGASSVDVSTQSMGGITIGANYNLASQLNGTISEIIIYDSDQTDNRKAIESNMADYHGNIDLPAGFDSGNDEVDGYVATWYDQSGNGNNAVQAVATSQPKIVEGGVLQDGIQFDGGQSLAKTTFTQGTLSQPNTAFAVSRILDVGAFAVVFDSSDAGARNFIRAASSEYRFYGGTEQVIAAQDTDQHLFTALFNTTNSDAYLDGVIEASSVDVGTHSMSGITIGARYDLTLPLNGTISEIIIYDSDQSLVRKNIEFNINNAYSIY